MYKAKQKELKLFTELPEESKVDWNIRVFKFSDLETYRQTYWQVRMGKLMNILLHVKSENLYYALKQVQKLTFFILYLFFKFS